MMGLNEGKDSMVTISVVFQGNYRLLTGQGRVEIQLPQGSSVNDLIAYLADRYGGDLRDQLIDPGTGKVWSLMALAVNGKILNSVEKFSLILKTGDEVLFLPPALGG
ncbi:MoaD/ThiS family protein [Desulfofundulus thermobenzoicus]|nr:MoaD/ThiS family protein [Desulfofundulus thermobenzoicus]